MENNRIAIVGGVRTPFAKAFTDLSDLNASDLAKVLKANSAVKA